MRSELASTHATIEKVNRPLTKPSVSNTHAIRLTPATLRQQIGRAILLLPQQEMVAYMHVIGTNTLSITVITGLPLRTSL